MKFTEHKDPRLLSIKSYQAGQVIVNDNTLTQSCFLNQHQLVADWACAHINQLTSELLDTLLTLKPEVILLGTGENQIFPHPKLFAHCAQQGVGLEVMNNAAACRTFNVLTSEERDVVLALIIEQP